MTTLSGNRKIIADGLVWVVDPNNPRSYPGSGTTLFDMSVDTPKDGTMVNGVGHDGKSLVLDGIDDHVDFGNTALDSYILGDGKTWSLTMWFNNDTMVGFDTIFSKWDNGQAPTDTHNTLRIATSNGNIDVAIRSNDASPGTRTNITYASSLSAGEWHSMTITFDDGLTGNNKLKMYLDGVIVTPSFSNTLLGGTQSPSSLSKWIMGAEFQTTPVNTWAGKLGLTYLHSKVLNATEVTQSFKAIKDTL